MESAHVVFSLGGLHVTRTVGTTWGLMLVVWLGGRLARRERPLALNV